MKLTGSNILIVIIFVLLVVGSIVYISQSDTKDLPNVILTFLSIFFSVVLGAIFSIILYNNQKQIQDERLLKALKTNLQAEITDMYEVLKKGTPLKVNGLDFTITFIQPIILEKSAKSDLFKSHEIENFLHVARKVRFYNLLVNHLLSIINSPKDKNFTAILSSYHANLERTKKGIIHNLEQILEQLELKFSDSIKMNRRPKSK